MRDTTDAAAAGPSPGGSPREVFGTFLRLGLTAFGGPVAHLGYFRDALVLRRRWVSEDDFAAIVGLCQFLPGPASSQAGFVLGMARGGGLLGGLAAWAAFTLPSAALLIVLALGASALTGPAVTGLLHGLKLTAVAVVAQAVWGMARTLTPDLPRAALALAALALASRGGAAAQSAAIAFGAIAGLWLCRSAGPEPVGGRLPYTPSRRQGMVALALFAAGLVLLPLLVRGSDSQALAVFSGFFRAGALVFGGGHVVLPLLEATVVPSGWVNEASFLAGYGLAQAVPGPLFTFAAWLGAVMAPPVGGIGGAILALVAIFLPGLLLVYGTLPFWEGLRRRPGARAAMRGANAAVVGILAAALYDPVWTGAVFTPADALLAAAGFAALISGRAPPWVVVASLAALGAAGGATGIL